MSALDARTASAIAAAMRAVALCDGAPDPREMALIDAFEADLPHDVDPTRVTLSTDEAIHSLLHSMWLVAWADGGVTPEERRMVLEIARAHEVPDARIHEAERAVRAELWRASVLANPSREARALASARLGHDVSDD